jgi:hypothetical protein
MKRTARWLALVVCALAASSPVSPAAGDDTVYQIVYGATLDPAAHRVTYGSRYDVARAVTPHPLDAPHDRYLICTGRATLPSRPDHTTPAGRRGVCIEYAIDHVRKAWRAGCAHHRAGRYETD